MSYAYEDHLAMMRDERRYGAYRAAIAATVRAGDTVLDLGAGAGMIAFCALEAGAEHVFAIDPADSVEVLRKVARANGLLDRITIFREDSRRVTLPRRADVLIADLRGALPALGDGLAVVRDARARHLAPGGRAIPLSDRIALAPVELPRGYESIGGWRGVFGGADYSCMTAVAANRFTRVPFGAEALLAAGAELPPIRYDDALRGDVSGELRYRAVRAGVCHGVGAWFEAELAPGVALSTAPEHARTVYGQGYFPIERAVEVAPGDELAVELALKTGPVEPVWRWRVRIARDGDLLLDEQHCSIDGEILTMDDLRKRGDRFVPKLNEIGRINRLVLDRMAEGVALGAIAREVHERFPERFPEPADAAAHVGKLSAAFSE